ncbi:MAG: recombination protein RecR [Candidatus Marinimicrobia bacterium]|nr:recombination protein RecR [Candidatus Neomarinimicrobiota bacterium]|tara:strand:+ start:215 stop:808 length:594 start_codon:yes stop_codon:yes gene_type:complete
MNVYPQSVKKLIQEFTKFPGIGKKTAQRLAFYIMSSSKENAANFAASVVDVKTMVKACTICGGIADNELCDICQNNNRDPLTVCVVEHPEDIFVFERTNSFRGVYHVLGGSLSPLDGIGPEDLNIQSLIKRIIPEMEIILATNASIEGDATALYLQKIFLDKNVTVTRLARGLPVGGELEYTDEATLMRALEGRTTF